MGKKIVVLNGSPRKAGNTSALVREFTKGMGDIEGKQELKEAYELGKKIH